MSDTLASDNELGTFLRTRREAVAPAEVGLPAGSRRRTPGLRRSELATLAGISVEYLTRLEQGRDRRPSAQVLGALADALRLSMEERMHLNYAANAAEGASLFPCPKARPVTQAVRPTVRALLETLEPTPAVLVNHLTGVLAHTGGYARVFGAVGALDGAEPNLARYVFTDGRSRAAYPDWDRVADEMASWIRQVCSMDQPPVPQLVRDLTIGAGAAFSKRVESQPAFVPRTGLQRLHHPEAGELRLSYEALELPPDDGQRLLVYLPADDATAAALDLLAGRRPGGLRAVNA
ncbi:helix-turn-helix domain-containing protein [Actinomadura hibisca]|uniref:helix-turn-helix domain-containing protein n=1 Tax=Actinomadura hibisca TaxID=68565 RepID=UPI0008372F25|nr:helix-turn-helix transcriptional regulator [Actinomadura hibisca]